MTEITAAQALTRVLETGKFVYVLYGVNDERGRTKLLGVYTTGEAAAEGAAIAKAIDGPYDISYVKMPIDKAAPTMLEA